MDTDTFWEIVDRSALRGGGDQGGQCEALRTALLALSPEEIVGFDAAFHKMMNASYTWDLWGAAYVMEGGCSDDGFDYFRAWLISQGRYAFESALSDPESMIHLAPDPDGGAEFESFMYVAGDAWAEKTGKDLFDMPNEREGGGGEPSGERWDEDEEVLAARYPKLWEKYGA